MDGVEGLLGADFQCEACSRRHAVTLREWVYGQEALARLPEVCGRHGRGRRVHVMSDARTHKAAGHEALSRLVGAGFHVSSSIVPDPATGRSPSCDDKTKTRAQAEIPPCDLLVAVGSGVINDLAKWIAFEKDTPYLVVATAASMNGYSSANVAATVKGVKTLFNARSPAAILSSPRILAQAPYEMTASGFGDLLAKFTSTTDWRLCQILLEEYYCDRCVELQKQFDPGAMTSGGALSNRDPRALKALFEALALSGILMTMAGSSAPASGGEHMISHTLDMMAALEGGDHDLHGRQVGVATVFTAALYQELLAMEGPRLEALPAELDRGFWGGMAQAVEGHHARKKIKAVRAVERLRVRPELWDEIRESLAPMVASPEVIKGHLQAAAAAHRLEDIAVSPERFLQAVDHAHEIRDRYTVMDLARAVGLLPGRGRELVARWLSA
jgi:glycerol-1-phosphate dehydrogenase [NAD(P)+]